MATAISIVMPLIKSLRAPDHSAVRTASHFGTMARYGDPRIPRSDSAFEPNNINSYRSADVCIQRQHIRCSWITGHATQDASPGLSLMGLGNCVRSKVAGR